MDTGPMRRMTDALPRAAFRAAYHAMHAARAVGSLALHQRYGVARRPEHADGLAAAARKIRERFGDLLERDLQAVEDGLVPRSLLFDPPRAEHLRRLRRLLREGSDIVQRRDDNRWRDLPDDVALDEFPPYYRRNFHWQRDGYLSADSAELYDVGVELLFLGGAEVMRRQVLPPIVRESRARGPRLRILDVACGTGPTLVALSKTLPHARLTGIDLSPWYLREARRRLVDHPHVDFLATPAEELPFRDDSFDVVTSTYLFHELPRAVRRQVFGEMARVLRPGGLLVVEDAAQVSESAEVESILRLFPGDFHEPYFEDYLGDALEDLAVQAGLTIDEVWPAYMAKVVTARSAA